MLLNNKIAKNEDPLCTPPDPANLCEGGRQDLEAVRTQQREADEGRPRRRTEHQQRAGGVGTEGRHWLHLNHSLAEEM